MEQQEINDLKDKGYYTAILDQNGNKSYKIVGLPEDDDQQPQGN